MQSPYPWEYDIIFYVENNRLFGDIVQSAETFEFIPLSEVEFLVTDGSRLIFTRDETGTVTGYRTWISLIHPIGGQWYEAIKLESEE